MSQSSYLTNSKLTSSLSNVSNVSTNSSSENSLYTITSPFEIQNIPEESEFLLLNTNRFNLSLKMLDKVVYLRAGDSKSNLTPIRGYLCIYIKKPIRISTIKLQFNGNLNIKYFPNNMPPNPLSSFIKNDIIPIYNQTRTWQYKQNHSVYESDYFAKGLFTYPFQFLIPNNIPETMSNVFGSTSYSIKVTVNPISNSITKSLISNSEFKESLPIQIIQCDTDEDEISTTSTDALSLGNWRNLFYYKIAVSNRQVTIGNRLKFYVKILPIDIYKYKLYSIKVYLDQTTEYNVADKTTPSERSKYHLFLSHTETILLEDINIESFDNDIQCWEFDCEIKKNHDKFNIKVKDKDKNINKKVTVVPSTNAIENKICHFKVAHKVKVVISAEEISIDEEPINFDNSDVISSFSMRSRSQSLDKTLFNTRVEKADNAMIRKMAKLIPETGIRKRKVDLLLDAEVEILKGESAVGKMPPPTYCDARLEKKSDSRFEEVSTKTFSILDFKKKDQKPQLNFIVPPAYEEIEELSEPPPYLKHS
jgi:hypothetical protein